jgi:hypothetical protein
MQSYATDETVPVKCTCTHTSPWNTYLLLFSMGVAWRAVDHRGFWSALWWAAFWPFHLGLLFVDWMAKQGYL